MRLRYRTFLSCCGLLATLPVPAQQKPPARNLQDLERAFAAQHDRLYAGEQAPTAQQEHELLRRHAEELVQFLQHEAAGDDRWNGRLLLAELRLELRDRDGAKAALEGIDADGASAMILLTAAKMAADLRQPALRDRLVKIALDRPASADERMAAAKALMTWLREVERGERIFAEALAAAKDDEQRALVRWHRAEAVREREDVPENSYYTELERLAKDLPATYWGGVARDRLLASQFKIGGEAVPFTATTTDGKRVELASLRGKAVVLAFWSADDPRAKDLVDALLELRRKHGDGLFVLGISLDRDLQAFQRGCTALGAAFPQVCDGRGDTADLALRYHVEVAPNLIVIDRQGRIAGLNLHVDSRDARDDLQAALQRALQ